MVSRSAWAAGVAGSAEGELLARPLRRGGRYAKDCAPVNHGVGGEQNAVSKIDTDGLACYAWGVAIRTSMNVSITPELEQFVQALVASGRYHSASEVFREGLRLLEQAEHGRLLDKWLTEGLSPQEEAKLPPDVLKHARELVRAKVREGLEAAQRGELHDGEEVFREILDQSRRRRASSRR